MDLAHDDSFTSSQRRELWLEQIEDRKAKDGGMEVREYSEHPTLGVVHSEQSDVIRLTVPSGGRCIGCGRYVAKGGNQCPNCYEDTWADPMFAGRWSRSLGRDGSIY